MGCEVSGPAICQLNRQTMLTVGSETEITQWGHAIKLSQYSFFFFKFQGAILALILKIIMSDEVYGLFNFGPL
jgi:hypothetical protein